MILKSFKTSWLIGSVLFLILSAGCGENGSEAESEVLIRVGDRVVTILDFKEAFELSKTEYASGAGGQPGDSEKARLRLLNELSVEMVILERAGEIGIGVTEDELEKTVAEIKSDYPEGEFEKTLLEFAVSYEAWKNRLKTRLIMDKVIDKELKNRITITSEDIAEHYKKHYQGRENDPGSDQPSADINEIIVHQLRRQKAEEAYKAWIEELKAKYEIEINGQLWEKITGAGNNGENEAISGDSKKS